MMPSAPTYATFGRLMTRPRATRSGQKATASRRQGGQRERRRRQSRVPGVDLVYYEPITQHNIPKVFWDFLNAQGPIYVNGQYTHRQINNPWFFASGLPVTEPYWAKVKIGRSAARRADPGLRAPHPDLRPGLQRPPFKVQMGNIGQHYYDWRYKGAGCATPPAPPTPLPVPTATATPGAASCSGVPAAQDATISPCAGPLPTRFQIGIAASPQTSASASG